MLLGKIYYADNFCLEVFKTSNSFDRMRGLLFRPRLKENQAMLIDRCNSIHTFGMSYNIDVVYLDKLSRIIKIVKDIKPWRMSACWQAKNTLELLAHSSSKLNLKLGQKIEWIKK